MEYVKTGDPFPLLKVDNLNQIISASNIVNRSASNITHKTSPPQIFQAVRIFNESGTNLNALSIVELGNVHIEYEQNKEMFLNRPAIKALKPGSAAGTKTYAVLTKSLENNNYGEAIISGVLTVKIDVKDKDHLYAMPINNDCSKLESAPEGVFKILCFEKTACQTGEQWCRVFFPVACGYSGYFKVIKSGADTCKVIDGADVQASNCGVALINGQKFNVTVASGISVSSDTYIYLEGTSTDNGDTVTINTPTIESADSFPDYEDGKCKILLARIVGGKIIQEHHGAVTGIIWGGCDE